MTFTEFCARYHLSLSEQQAAAVQRSSGQTLLIAVPGSGKTTAILARIAYLICCCQVPAESILAITYSRASAAEMENRFRQAFPRVPGVPKFQTIHAFCLSLLSYAAKQGRQKLPELLPSNSRQIRTALRSFNSTWPSDYLVRELGSLLTLSKNQMQTAEQRQKQMCRALTREYPGLTFDGFFGRYQDTLAQADCMDFDDLLIYALKLLQANPNVSAYVHRTYRHICLDEAQDTSLIQFRILDQLADGADSYFLVGDDDQSIYSFRGAEPSYILNFQKHYPQAQVLYLDTNYRSLPALVQAANRFISGNQQRYRKTATPSRTGQGSVRVQPVSSPLALYTETRNAVSETLKTPGRTLGILARNNFTLLPLAMDLDRRNLPANRRDNFSAFFLHPTVSGILAVLSLSQNPGDVDALYQGRYLIKLFLTSEQADKVRTAVRIHPEWGALDAVQKLFPGEAKLFKAAGSAHNLLHTLSRQKPPLAVRTLTSISTRADTGRTYGEVLYYLASQFEDIPTFLARMRQYAKAGTTTAASSQSPVTLTTIHSAKGLEFDKVILLDALNGVLPQSDTFGSNQLSEEEDARLFYVAATRAKEELLFLVPSSFFEMSTEPSPFLTRLTGTPMPPAPPAPQIRRASVPRKNSPLLPSSSPLLPPPGAGRPKVSFSVGDAVSHVKFGKGVVQEVSGPVLTIQFGDAEPRKIHENFVSHT